LFSPSICPSSQGMLEPTKESQKSPASPALSPSVSVESGNILCTQVRSADMHMDISYLDIKIQIY